MILNKARIVAVEHRAAQDAVTARMRFVAAAPGDVAQEIGASWMLDPRAPVGVKVPITFSMESVRVCHEVTIQKSKYRLQVEAHAVDHFKVFRSSDGLMVAFVISTQRSAFDLLEHLLKTGDAEGVCTLEAMQAEMFEDEPIEKHLSGAALEQHRAQARRTTQAD
jgi:hypothetical protein